MSESDARGRATPMPAYCNFVSELLGHAADGRPVYTAPAPPVGRMPDWVRAERAEQDRDALKRDMSEGRSAYEAYAAGKGPPAWATWDELDQAQRQRWEAAAQDAVEYELDSLTAASAIRAPSRAVPWDEFRKTLDDGDGAEAPTMSSRRALRIMRDVVRAYLAKLPTCGEARRNEPPCGALAMWWERDVDGHRVFYCDAHHADSNEHPVDGAAELRALLSSLIGSGVTTAVAAGGIEPGDAVAMLPDGRVVSMHPKRRP